MIDHSMLKQSARIVQWRATPGGPCPASEQTQQSFLLISGQLRRASLREVSAQLAQTALGQLLGPLADRGAADAQVPSNFGSGPALAAQQLCGETTAFFKLFSCKGSGLKRHTHIVNQL